MHAALELEPRVGAFAAHLKHDLFIATDARLIARDDLGLPAVGHGVERVHAIQIGRKEPSLIAASPRTDLDDDALAVSRVLGH